MDSASSARQPDLVAITDEPGIRRFGPSSYLQEVGDEYLVMVRGALLGRFRKDDRATRNIMLVAASQSARRGEKQEIAKAFGVAYGTLWQLERVFREGGAAAVVERAPGGVQTLKVTAAVRRRMERLFERGGSVSQVQKAVGLSRGSVGRVRAEWAARKRNSTEAPPAEKPMAEETAPLEPIASVDPGDGQRVQHVGSWLLVGMTASIGLHEAAERHRPTSVNAATLRLALDAFICALALGERCAEGIRRLATASAGALLLSAAAPSASWVRRVLHRFAEQGDGHSFQFDLAGTLARESATDAVAVFYVDNHMRSYTGQHVLRKGWRMQDRCAVPGTTDFWVHDEEGRPVFRVESPDHASLAALLSPIATCLRLALGAEQRVLLAFDRGGAYPEVMARLRDAGVGLVTYERKPYALLSPGLFSENLTLEDGERVGVFEDQNKNLGGGRGRVRRICVRTEDGRQVNLVAVSDLPAEDLIAVMRGRWRQENGFKHGKERWGINQLDGRRCEPVPPGTIVPNPSRRRLEHALGLVRRWEGELRNRLARAAPGSAEQARLHEELNEALAKRAAYEAQRPQLPTHAPVEETELAGKLVRHAPQYKKALDTVRTACANAESELAALLGPMLPKPEEAKRALRNLFQAPGDIVVEAAAIRVELQPAGSGPELQALGQLCELLDQRELHHPGDPRRRPLRFRVRGIQVG